jgi:hypothetical protein
MRVWLWDASPHHGITDDEVRALEAAEAHVAPGEAARVEMAIAAFGFRALSATYYRTGIGWEGHGNQGRVQWKRF